MTARKWSTPTSQKIGDKWVRLVEYDMWYSLTRRCKIGNIETVTPKAYTGCTHAPEWGSYDTFLMWAKQQVGYLSRDEQGHSYPLDKDILCKGNRTYCPDFCIFVPREVNCFFNIRPRGRGSLPCGVNLLKRSLKFVPRISGGKGKVTHLGVFDTPEEAFCAYKIAKELKAKQLAIKYAGLVDPRVIDALNNFQVNIDD